MKLSNTLLTILLSQTLYAAPLSTNKDGSFQAISLTPTKIAVYNLSRDTIITSDGKILEPTSTDKNGYVCYIYNNLTPNTQYTFTRKSDNTTIGEKTPCANEDTTVDLLVIGATASGISAAISAARLGLEVAIAEETNRIGGIAANGLGYVDIINLAHASGIFSEFMANISDFYGTPHGNRYEPRVANAVYKKMCHDENIKVFINAKTSPVMDQNKVCGATINNKFTIRAKIAIDASDTGDFASLCNTDWRAGREARSKEEPHAGKIYFDNTTQTILDGSSGKSDKRQQSYAYLMTLKDYGVDDAPQIEKPQNYDPKTYEHSPLWHRTWNATSGKLPNDEYEVNQHPFGSDLPGINYDYPFINDKKREKIHTQYRARALGYLYFLQNERGCKNLGLAADEYLDTQNFPQSLYVRECKRIIADYIFNESDVIYGQENYDIISIGIGDYAMDSHAMEDLKDPNAKHRGEGEFWLKSLIRWYRIPYQIMIPKNTENLLVSTCVSSTHVGYSTLRIEFTRSSIGEAASVFAYAAIKSDIPIKKVDPFYVQQLLLRQGQYINWKNDVTPHDNGFEAISILGAYGIFRDEDMRGDDIATETEAIEAVARLSKHLGKNEYKEESTTKKLTRGKLAKYICKAFAWAETPQKTTYYSDTEKNIYGKYAETMKMHSIGAYIFNDYDAYTFDENKNVTRTELAKVLYAVMILQQ